MLKSSYLELLTQVHHDTGFLSSDLRKAHADAPESDPALEIVLYALLERAAALHNDVNRLVQPYLRLGEAATKGDTPAVPVVVESATKAHDRRMAEGRALLATLGATLFLQRLDSTLHFGAQSLKEFAAASDLLESLRKQAGPSGFRGELCEAMDAALRAQAAVSDALESLAQAAGVLRSLLTQQQ